MIVTYGAIGYGYTAVRCNVTVPQTEVQCLSVEGIGKNHHWIISHNIETTNGGIGAVSPPSEATTSYIPPEISTIYVSNATSNHELLTAGGDVVVLNGSNFGPKGTNVIGRYQNDDNSDGRGVLLSGLMHTVPNCTVVVESTVADQFGDMGAETKALGRATTQQFEQYIKLNKKIASEVLSAVEQVDETDKIADMIASHLAIKISEKQELLETLDIHARLEAVFGHMEGEIGALQVEKRVRNRVKRQMEKTQREYYLNEQMKAIQKELGENDEGVNELDEIENQLKALKMPKAA